MSKMTNDVLTRSGTGCFIYTVCTITTAMGVKGLTRGSNYRSACDYYPQKRGMVSYRNPNRNDDPSLHATNGSTANE